MRGRCTATGMGPLARTWTSPSACLDAPRFKEELKSATVPLALVASDYIYQSIIRHGYDGIDDTEFLPLVTVKVGDQRRKGWVHFPFAGGIPVGRTNAAPGLLRAANPVDLRPAAERSDQ